MAISSVYLSGWEYNRLVGDDPVVPAASGLPAQCLWEGTAQFFLFKRIYCTKESYEGELAAAESLGWSTGFIFKRLNDEGVLEPFDWQEEVKKYPPLAESLKLRAEFVRKKLELSDVSAKAAILKFIEAGADADLEALKAQLLEPILKHLNCASNVSPNSVRCWFEGNTSLQQADLVRHMIEPLVDAKQRIKAGISLCRPPGSGVSTQELAKQQEEESARQKPLIPALLIGDLPQNDYHELLKPGVKAYRAINQQLWNDFEGNLEKLKRLRDIADKHVWRDLHGEWLPRLREEAGYEKEFRGLIRRALRIERFDPWLDKATDLAIYGITPLLATAMAIGAAKSGVNVGEGSQVLPGISGAGIGAGLGRYASSIMKAKKDKARKQAEGLVQFYQSARLITRAKK